MRRSISSFVPIHTKPLMGIADIPSVKSDGNG